MRDSGLIEAIRSLLRSDETDERGSASVPTSGGTEVPVDEFSGEWSDGFPVPTERDGELRDLLIEMNVTTHEYIRLALEHHGGRLRQQEITDLTGWSEPTVSQKLGEMEDAGHVTRFRTGREKIVCLPGNSPVDAVQESDDEDSSTAATSSSGAAPSTPTDRDAPQLTPDGSAEEPDGVRPEQDVTPPDQDGAPGNTDVPSQ